VIYSQLMFEKAKLENIKKVIYQLLSNIVSNIVRDINTFIMCQMNEYFSHFTVGLKENQFPIIKEPKIDFEHEKGFITDYVLTLDAIFNSSISGELT
jgi:hypothetical protein